MRLSSESSELPKPSKVRKRALEMTLANEKKKFGRLREMTGRSKLNGWTHETSAEQPLHDLREGSTALACRKCASVVSPGAACAHPQEPPKSQKIAELRREPAHAFEGGLEDAAESRNRTSEIILRTSRNAAVPERNLSNHSDIRVLNVQLQGKLLDGRSVSI